MRGKNTKCKKIRKVVAFTMLGISALGLSNYAESHSVYKTSNENEPLAYAATVHPRYKGTFDVKLLGKNDETGPYSSDYKNAFFQFTFSRNNVVNKDVVDTYSVVVPASCTVLKGEFTGTAEISRDKKQITYKRKGNEEATIYMTCPVEKIATKVNGVDTLKVDVTIQETIGEGKDQINISRYKDGTFTRSLSDYYNSYPTPDMGVKWSDTYLQIPKDLSSQFFDKLKTNSLVYELKKYLTNFDYNSTFGSDDPKGKTTEEQLYIIFEKIWLENIVCKYNNTDCEAIKKYVKASYPNYQSITSDKKLPGFKVIVNNSSNYYRYEIVDNFLGYVRTANDNQNMYFSTNKDEILNSAFDYYLKTYSYIGNSTLLKNYVNSFTDGKGISYLINNGVFSSSKITLNGQNIYGMIYDKTTQKLSFEPELVAYASSRLNKTVQFDVKAYSTKLSTVLARCLEYAYGDIVSSKTLDIIRTDANNIIVGSVRKNVTDYIVWYDEGNQSYLYFAIQPNGNTTSVEVSKLNSKIENGKIIFEFSDKNQDKLLHIVQALDIYFKIATNAKPVHTSLKNDTYITTTSNGDVTNVVYQIPENLLVIPFGSEEEMLATFKSGLEKYYKDVVSYEAIDKYALDSVVKNNTTLGSQEVYSEYFAYKENGKYQLVNIYSDGINTYATVSEIPYTLNNNVININLQDEDEDKLLQIVQALDYLFNVVDSREDSKQLHKVLDSDSLTYYVLVNRTSSGTEVNYKIPDKKITIPVGSSNEMVTTFVNRLNSDYSDIVSATLRNWLKNNKNPITEAIYNNCSSSDDALCFDRTNVFRRTYRVTDQEYGHKVLFEVYSDGIKTYVVVSVEKTATVNSVNSLYATNSIKNISVPVLDDQAAEKDTSSSTAPKVEKQEAKETEKVLETASVSEDENTTLKTDKESSVVNKDFTTSAEETKNDEVSLQESKNKLVVDDEKSEDEKDVSVDTSDDVSIGSADAPLDSGVADAPSETVHQTIESIDNTVNEILPVDSG